MFCLVLYRDEDDFPLIGPFKSADAAIKHLRAIQTHSGQDWRIAPLHKPIAIKTAKKAKKRAKR